jgi:ribonuclease BN (tRNA processing enzyme)
MPVDGSHALTQGARELCEGADLLIHDSQYTLDEFAKKANWGHCTIDYALWVAEECRVKTLALFHHDPTRSDDELDAIAEMARLRGANVGFDVIAAVENQTITLPMRG